MNEHFDLAAILIRAGADIDKWDFYGRTPLYNAVDMNTPPRNSRVELPSLDAMRAIDIVAMLLDRGADPNIQLKHRPRYRDAISEGGADVILSTGATPLLRAARAADLDAITLLLKHGAIVDLPDQYGVTPFMAASGVGFGIRASRGRRATEGERIEALKMLLTAGADVNRRTLSQGRLQPPGKDNFLWRIRIMQNRQKLLFSYVPPDGRVALHGAARNGWNKVVAFLVQSGAMIDVTDSEGRTPVDLAAGRYDPPFLVPNPDPHTETLALLKTLCEQQDGCKFPSTETAQAGGKSVRNDASPSKK